MEDILKKYYPVTIILDRYGGSYAGGEWLCFLGCDPEWSQGGDTDAMDYWDRGYNGELPPLGQPDINAGIGVGSTITEAVVLATRSVETGRVEGPALKHYRRTSG